MADRPRPAICGKMNHIQWLRFCPAASSARTLSMTGAWAVTKRSSSWSSPMVMRSLMHAFDLGAAASEFLFYRLVAAIEMVHARDGGFAFGGEGGQDQGEGGAQVSCHDWGAGEFGHAADDGGGAVDIHLGAHAVELRHMHEAILEDGL